MLNIFENCSDLTSVTIPNSVTSINGFSNCTGLTSITIPNSVASIGNQAFYGCSKLAKIEIGKSIKDINSKAFANCEQLSNIICLAKDVPSTATDAFVNSYIDYATLHVRESSIDAYKTKSPWSSFKTIVAADIPMYTLIYMVDGTPYKTVKYEEGDEITPEAEPIKDGYVFSGWSEIPETMPAYDVTVTGLYTVDNTKYTLTYMVDGEVYKSYQLKDGSTIIPEAEPTKEGYTFSGWSEIPEEMPAHDVTITGTFKMISLGKCSMPTISFVDGKLVFESETDDADCHYEIKVEDAKEGVSSEVTLSSAYEITVYASKEGYDDSEKNTATLYWVNVDPISNGVIDIEIKVNTNAILVQNDEGLITISGVADGNNVMIYNTSGQLIAQGTASGNSVEIDTNLSSGDICIIKIGDRSVKYIVR